MRVQKVVGNGVCRERFLVQIVRSVLSRLRSPESITFRLLAALRAKGQVLRFVHSSELCPDGTHPEVFLNGISHRHPPLYDIQPTIPPAPLRTLRYMSCSIPLANKPTTSRSLRPSTAPLIVLRDKRLFLLYFTYQTRSPYVHFVLFHSRSHSCSIIQLSVPRPLHHQGSGT